MNMMTLKVTSHWKKKYIMKSSWFARIFWPGQMDPTALQMKPGCRYFTKSCKQITTHATITDKYIPSVFTIAITDGLYPSVVYREFWNIYRSCQIIDAYSVGDYLWKYSRTYSVGKVLAGIFLARFAVCKTVDVCFFYFNRGRDGMGNYRRLIFRRTYSVSDAVGKNFTNELRALHWRNKSINKTV